MRTSYGIKLATCSGLAVQLITIDCSYYVIKIIRLHEISNLWFALPHYKLNQMIVQIFQAYSPWLDQLSTVFSRSNAFHSREATGNQRNVLNFTLIRQIKQRVCGGAGRGDRNHQNRPHLGRHRERIQNIERRKYYHSPDVCVFTTFTNIYVFLLCFPTARRRLNYADLKVCRVIS